MDNSKEIFQETSFQTAGPFLHIGCMPNSIGIKGIYSNDIGIRPFEEINDDLITIQGSVYDGNEEALDDVLLETWQSDKDGKYSSDRGFARFAPDKITKQFKLTTVKPGLVKNFDGSIQSPHILLSLSSRGLNMTLNTRIYFEDDDLTNDPLMALIRKRKNNIDSLIAKKINKTNYIFNIFLQGKNETVFLDI